MFLLPLSVFLIRHFCFLSHFLKEIGVVLSNIFRTGMIGAKMGAPSLISSSGMASGARKAHRRINSMAAGLARSTWSKASDHLCDNGFTACKE